MLRVRRDGDVLVWTIARPAARNALDAATLDALEAAADEVEAQSTARAVVLEGEGDAFCAGGDLKQAGALVDPEPTGAFSDRGHHVLGRLEALRVPVIAAVRGAAIGGGAELAIACDVRVVDATTRLSFKHARMATVTSWGTTARLLALVGRGRALHALLTARDFSGEEAVRAGLAEVLAADAREGALALAHEMARSAPSAVAALKRLVRGGGARALERQLFVETWTGPEHIEAVRAHFERRAPDWAQGDGGRGGTT